MHTTRMEPTIDIKSIREKLEWTQEQMAEYLGLDRSSVSRMENGQEPKGPTRRLLIGLVEAPSTPPSPFPHPSDA